MSDPKKQSQTGTAEKSLAASLFDYVELFVFAAAAVILLLTFCLRLCVVNGDSMNNTLISGERLLVSDVFYTPEQGDVIVFHQTSDTDEWLNEPIVKRVLATEGQFVKINYAEKKIFVSDDNVFSDDEVIDETSYAYFEGGLWFKRPYYEADFSVGVQVPEGHLFVLGDNRNNSVDSRDLRVSFVDERRVLGKVLFRITPFSKFGPVS